jgi:DNA-binding transcriptional ArsR family regulator
MAEVYGVLKALAEPRRVEILKLLTRGELRAGEIAQRFDLTHPAISEHLRVLVEARLLVRRSEGTRRIYALRKEGLVALSRFLDQFWDDKLQRLKAAAEDEGAQRRGRRKTHATSRGRKA